MKSPLNTQYQNFFKFISLKCLLVTSIFVTPFCGFTQEARVRPKETKESPEELSIRLDVKKFQLKNGLTVLLHKDDSAPLVSYHTWYRVGSRDEEKGYTGMAHLFEHMMFKGAKRYDGKSFDRLLGAAGANHNAFTTRDYTAYYAVLPSNKLELIADLESDRMENLKITAENLKSEREVVKEERRFRVDNQPRGTMFEAIYSTLFRSSNYHWPVIGWMEDLDRITVEKCKEFFMQYYAPNNATVVIVGNFDISKTKSLIQEYYDDIPAQKIPPRVYPVEPDLTSMRQRRVSKNVQNEHLSVSFKTVPAGNEDSYSLDIAASIFGDGSSSRLYKTLVYQKQLATIVDASHLSAMGPGVWNIYVSLKPQASHDEALQSVYRMIWDLRNKLVTPVELEKAKNQMLKSSLDSLKTVNGKAMSLAYNQVVLGDYKRLMTDINKYNQVTAEDVRRVSAKYLNANQRTLVVMNRFAAPVENNGEGQ